MEKPTKPTKSIVEVPIDTMRSIRRMMVTLSMLNPAPRCGSAVIGAGMLNCLIEDGTRILKELDN